MTNREKQLNEKLLKFAGFKFQHYEAGFIEARPVKICDAHWVAPNGKCYKNEELLNSNKPPSFPDSLDACFKWLVPKLGKRLIGINFIPPTDRQNMWLCNVEFDTAPLESYRAKGDTPGESLCLALEKLIEVME